MSPKLLLAADAFTPSTRQVAIMALLAATILYAYWYSRRRMARAKWPEIRRTELDSGASNAAARNELATLVKQLDDLSRQVEGRLEARVAALEQSIHNADQRIAVLRTLLVAAQSAGVQIESGRVEKNPASSSLKPQVEDSTRRASSLLDPRTRRIYELADAGRTAPQIAQELQQRIGEVELILNLRETAQHANDRAA
ncbi:MAG TPA: hypothetical protein VJZ71_06180 [Phycisphaerae bacterium]|nr:hypothetical protein [Phycisphaerae bacterium]